MNNLKGLLCLLGLLSSGCIWSSSNELVLGHISGVSQLYSYPNNCSEICYESMSLEQTVAHYLDQSLQRDGYAGQVQVRLEDGLVKVQFPETVPGDYGNRLMTFLGRDSRPWRQPVSSMRSTSGPTTGASSFPMAWRWRTIARCSCCTFRQMTP